MEESKVEFAKNRLILDLLYSTLLSLHLLQFKGSSNYQKISFLENSFEKIIYLYFSPLEKLKVDIKQAERKSGFQWIWHFASMIDTANV